MKTFDDPRIRLMSRGAYPMVPGMDVQQVESHRAKWVRSVERLGEHWVILRQPPTASGVVFLPSKVSA